MNANWTQIPIKNSFDPEARQNPQFVALSDNRRLVINGGHQFGSTPIRNHSIVFDVQNNTWQKLPDFLGENNTRSEGTAVTIPSAIDDTIVLFGGKVFMRNNTVETTIPYVNSTIYNTSSRVIWGRNNYTASTGSKIPSKRQYLTTVLASDFQHIIMYGGENDKQVAVPDFMYTLDLNNNTWIQVNVKANGSGFTRTAHSGIAILELPYADNSNTYAQTMLAYNVTDLSNIHPIDYYYSDAISTNITLDQPSLLTPSTPLPDIKPLSTGAKAGIAVGSIVGAVAIFSALFLLYHKKPMKYMQPSVQDPDEHIMDEMNDLDWNNIERQYFELDTSSTTAVAESLYRNSTDQQVLSLNANTNSTYTVLKTTEVSQTPNVEVTHIMESPAQTPDVSTFHIAGLSQTTDAVTK
ncbi:hypothetical protein RMATCC62417_06467 [Rhizopus microsporus]|nr:hypothetical protein RMATCC62417_06467 [Rhizopus microsporus]